MYYILLYCVKRHSYLHTIPSFEEYFEFIGTFDALVTKDHVTIDQINATKILNFSLTFYTKI